MKFTIMFVAFLMTQMTFAQTKKEKRIKQEMVERIELLIEKVELTREDLEKEDVINACKTIKEMFQIFPDHLKGIGSHMDFEKRRTIKAKDLALSELIFMHKQSLICDQGKDAENVDAKELRKELKHILHSLKKQRRIIKRADTGSENSFYYRYEF